MMVVLVALLATTIAYAADVDITKDRIPVSYLGMTVKLNTWADNYVPHVTCSKDVIHKFRSIEYDTSNWCSKYNINGA